MKYTFKPSIISRTLAVINGLFFGFSAYWIAAAVFSVPQVLAILIALVVGIIEGAAFYFLLSRKWIGHDEAS